MPKFLAHTFRNVHKRAFDATAASGGAVTGRGRVVSVCLGAVLVTVGCGNLAGYKRPRLRPLTDAGEVTAATTDAAAGEDASPSSRGLPGGTSSGSGSGDGVTSDAAQASDAGTGGGAAPNPTEAVVSTSSHAASGDSERDASTDDAGDASVTSAPDAGGWDVSSAERKSDSMTASFDTSSGPASTSIPTSEPPLECMFPQADCDDSPHTCETDLTSELSCGASCEDKAVCDALSAGRCVNGGCSHAWAAWPMPNSGEVLGVPNPLSYTVNDQGTTTTEDDTVTDNVTGLMWQRATSATQYSRPDALNYCEGLSLAGHADWRLPTRIELVSLIDYGTDIGSGEPTIDINAFPGTQSSVYWTASAHAPPIITDPWLVGFNTGNVGGGPAFDYWVRCVR